MIVGVDARHLAGGRGVAHYTAASLRALAAAHPQDEWRAFVPGRAPVDVPAGVSLVRHRLPSRVLFGAGALAGRPSIDAVVGGADVVWIPAPAPVAASGKVPYVLSVMDVSWLERSQDFTRYERLWHAAGRLERLARRATAVVTISAATRDAMVRHWPLDPARVHVVHPGVTAPGAAGGQAAAGEATAGEGAASGGRRAPFFLALGALEPRKAPDIIARAHALARSRGLEADLVFAGAGRLAPLLAGPGVHVLGRVDEVAPLLRDALALVMPSRLEGFGFPPLEAALAGTPSIVSDLPVFAETLGDTALRVPVDDEKALADALLTLEQDAPLRDRLARDAAARAATFTWERSAAALHAVLTEAAAR